MLSRQIKISWQKQDPSGVFSTSSALVHQSMQVKAGASFVSIRETPGRDIRHPTSKDPRHQHQEPDGAKENIHNGVQGTMGKAQIVCIPTVSFKSVNQSVQIDPVENLSDLEPSPQLSQKSSPFNFRALHFRTVENSLQSVSLSEGSAATPTELSEEYLELCVQIIHNNSLMTLNPFLRHARLHRKFQTSDDGHFADLLDLGVPTTIEKSSAKVQSICKGMGFRSRTTFLALDWVHLALHCSEFVRKFDETDVILTLVRLSAKFEGEQHFLSEAILKIAGVYGAINDFDFIEALFLERMGFRLHRILVFDYYSLYSQGLGLSVAQTQIGTNMLLHLSHQGFYYRVDPSLAAFAVCFYLIDKNRGEADTTNVLTVREDRDVVEATLWKHLPLIYGFLNDELQAASELTIAISRTALRRIEDKFFQNSEAEIPLINKR